MRKKLLSVLMTLCLLVIMIPGNVMAQTNSNEIPDVTISTVREFLEFAHQVNNGNSYAGKLIKLANDIKFDGVTINNYSPIGNYILIGGSYYKKEFNGIFDGAGYVISGIDVTNKGYYSALFGYVGSSGIIRNVNLQDSTFTGVGYNSASIAGYNGGKIENCHVKGVNISGYGCGGVALYNDGIILNCSYSGSIESGSDYVGGVAGTNRGYIYNSYNTGNIISSDSDYINHFVGGVVGKNYSSGVVQNCYNTGMIYDSIGGYGGIVGLAEGIVANSYCSEESAPVNIYQLIGTEKNNKALLLSEMSTAAFTETLNYNRGDNTTWLKWELTSDYPSLVKQYEVTFNTTENGSVNTDWSYTHEGQTVTLATEPSRGYVVSSVTVKTSSGDTINTTMKDGKYQFTMPKDKVVVTTTFVNQYTVTFNTTKNGSIKTNLSNAYKGQAVTLTVTPKKGYTVSSVVVKTSNGKKIKTTKKNGKYQFTMPADKVVVKTTFKKK